MSDVYLIAFDGSASSHRALSQASKLAHSSGASLLLAHVLEWSPYSFLGADELAERHKRREEEVGRAEKIILKPIKEQLESDGFSVETTVRYGHVAETLSDIAKEESVVQLFVGRTGDSAIQARIFGSVPGTLAQIAPVPCTIVP